MSGPVHVLGLSADYHDAAAALITDGVVVAAAEEERFTRRKHDPSIPSEAIAFCLEAGGLGPDDLDAVAFYEKPLSKFGRILRTQARMGLRGVPTFVEALPIWSRRKLWVAYRIEMELRRQGFRVPGRVLFAEHHQSHAAGAFFPSPFTDAAVLTFDGVGEWATTSIGIGRGNRVTLLEELHFPDSIGLLYSTFTAFCGFEVNEGEYKLMGLAPYGEPRYADRIREHLVTIAEDGSFHLDQRAFAYLAGRKMAGRRFEEIFDGVARTPDAPITRREVDLARSVQEVTEELVLGVATRAHRLTGSSRAVLSGGVALNCVANGRLLRDGPFDELWIQPAAGDAGSALGCALFAFHELLDHPRVVESTDGMRGSLLGPSVEQADALAALDEAGASYEVVAAGDRAALIAQMLADGLLLAVCQGPMEFGPRALGNRSILADPRNPGVQSALNQKVKFRESFRPFAPAVLAEHAAEWFDLAVESPYMLLTAPVKDQHLLECLPADPSDVMSALGQVRSTIPAVTHVDGSARVQTVTVDRSPSLHAILSAFYELTGCPVLVNTSFNVRGEPIVCTAADAYACFAATDLDVLVVADCVVRRDPSTPSARPRPAGVAMRAKRPALG
jgi:carbamoyltransferase